MLFKRYESTEVDRRTWLHVPSGTHWFTSSDTHQVVEIQIETSKLDEKEITGQTICRKVQNLLKFTEIRDDINCQLSKILSIHRPGSKIKFKPFIIEVGTVFESC